MGAPDPPLSPGQYARYRRHLSLPEFGVEGQRALAEARVLLVGAGGLGCPVAQYLAAAGVGTLGLVDDDVVDVSNLQRQVLYGDADVGRPKLEVARERIRAQNPEVAVEAHPVRLTAANALDLLRDYHVVVDGTDNFPTRYLVNDACVLLGRPNVHGSIFRFEGQMTVFDPPRGPCYRCLYPEPPPPGSVPSCAEGGVLGVLPGLVGLVQAVETLKLVAKLGESLVGRLLTLNALDMRFDEYRLRRDPDCPVCGKAPRITALEDLEGYCEAPARGHPAAVRELAPVEVQALRASGEEFLLLDVREPDEHARARIEDAHLVPLASLPDALDDLAAWRRRRVVVHCHHGVRSARACELLQARGFERVFNLSGGIEGWSLSVDASVPRY